MITTWVNGLKIAEVNTATLRSPNYDPAAIHAVLGDRGHLALEVHDNDALFGDARWGRGAQCRWRNARIKDIGPALTDCQQADCDQRAGAWRDSGGPSE